jgi:hypothetical protein
MIPQLWLCRTGFAVGVRELLGHDMQLEEFPKDLYLGGTTDMAIRIDEVVSCVVLCVCAWLSDCRKVHKCRQHRAGGSLAVALCKLSQGFLIQTKLHSISVCLQVSGSLTSSVVDDAFFILKKCGSRALATRSIHCVCAILGQLNDLLANKLKGALLAKIAIGPSKLLAAAPAMPTAADAGAASPAVAAAANEYAVAINNIDVASEYISKLRQELEGHAERLFTSASEQDRLRRCGACICPMVLLDAQPLRDSKRENAWRGGSECL